MLHVTRDFKLSVQFAWASLITSDQIHVPGEIGETTFLKQVCVTAKKQ
jgi:hypothetical protein